MTNTQILQAITGNIKELTRAFEQHKISQPIDLKKEWIDKVEVMQVLRMSERSIQRLRNCGALPFTRVHGRILYKRTDVESLLESNYQKVERNQCGC
jgi:hypothetical protein